MFLSEAEFSIGSCVFTGGDDLPWAVFDTVTLKTGPKYVQKFVCFGMILFNNVKIGLL